MNVYADSSFIVAVYVRDRHSVEALRRMSRRPRVWLTPLHRLEFSHAIAQQVFRGNLSASEAAIIFERFDQDCTDFIWEIVKLPVGTFQGGIALARTQVASYGTRSFDTLHIASAFELGSIEFWTFDERQAKMAKALGLQVS
ncbi:type II toxin-antitoxin system VapC family toxin [Acidisarcina polymorpha]|uniref:type II toxin-antitoxin system VapC family toxin n=1 Tax=Acidisarcina polymorpha TaxID=2211140 RepID=UPI000DEF9FB5